MSKNEFPEKEQETLPAAEDRSSVDFGSSDPLFSQSGDRQDADAQEDAAVTFTPEEETVAFVPDSNPVDFSDLGPLFEGAGETPVVAGQAAQVLKKLREMPEDSPVPEGSEEQAIAEAVLEEAGIVPEGEADPLFSQEEPAQEESAREAEEAEDPEDSASADLQAEEAEEEAAEEASPDSDLPLSEEAAEGDPDSIFPSEETAEIGSDSDPDSEQPEEHLQEQPEKPAYRRSARKGRPKRKKGEGFFGIPNLLVTVVWIAITVLIGVTLGRMAWVCAADVLAFGRDAKPVTVTIYEADTIDDITKKLHDGGLIRYPGLFKLYASLAVDEGEIHPGIWDLNTMYDYHALVNMMSPSSSREVIELMIPEGYSCRQIFELMEENKICTSLDLGAYAASGELEDYWFLEGVERGDMYCLEGYLFPDTYQFYKNDSPRNVLTKMLNNFQNRFDEAMVAQIDTLNGRLADLMRQGGHNEQFIEEHRFTVRDVINVASLIEKETSSADEGYVIASVIYNRLFNWPGNVPYLNIDATIVYALGGKNKLTQEDLKVSSPYNTYTHTGLTPGPIANPGLSSIRAALDPSDSNYYYYVLDPALGSHRFSTTYDEHKANIASIGG